MGNQLLFFGNVFAHLVALMSGIASFCIAVWQAYRKHPLPEKLFWVIGAICLLSAFDFAWQDEHRNAQTVIAEKAAISGEANSCRQNALIADAYRRGLEGANLTERQTIDRQQSAVNSCVVSLGKMNPVINTHVSTIAYQIATRQQKDMFGVIKKDYFYAIVVMITRRMEPAGNLKCDQAFSPQNAELHVKASVAMIASPTLMPVSDREYSIRITNTGAFWEDGNPIVLSATSDSDHLNCSFIP